MDEFLNIVTILDLDPPWKSLLPNLLTPRPVRKRTAWAPLGILVPNAFLTLFGLGPRIAILVPMAETKSLQSLK